MIKNQNLNESFNKLVWYSKKSLKIWLTKPFTNNVIGSLFVSDLNRELHCIKVKLTDLHKALHTEIAKAYISG